LDADAARKAALGDALHVIENIVDVDRLGRERTLVAEDLHAVDEIADAIGLRADETRKCAVLSGKRGLEKLRGTPDSGERVLDLMREHGSKPRDRARGGAMRKLALDHLRHGALLQ